MPKLLLLILSLVSVNYAVAGTSVNTHSESAPPQKKTPPVVILNPYYPIVGDYDPDFLPDDSYFSKSPTKESNAGRWLRASNGSVPSNSVVFNIVNGQPVYRCRSVQSIYYNYGVLIPGRGCYIKDEASTTFHKTYDIQVAY